MEIRTENITDQYEQLFVEDFAADWQCVDAEGSEVTLTGGQGNGTVEVWCVAADGHDWAGQVDMDLPEDGIRECVEFLERRGYDVTHGGVI